MVLADIHAQLKSKISESEREIELLRSEIKSKDVVIDELDKEIKTHMDELQSNSSQRDKVSQFLYPIL